MAADAMARVSRWAFAPILVKELRATFRGWRFFLSHTILLSLFALILLIALVGEMTDVDPNPTRVGRMIFYMLVVFQGVLVGLVLPAFGCTAIVGEREKKSFDLLLTTTLTPAEIVWGKFCATMAYSCLFLVSTLPLVAVAFLFGGVSLADLGVSYGFLLVCSVLLNLYAVFISTAVKSSQRGVVTCYFFLLPLSGVLIFLATLAAGELNGTRYFDRILDGRAAELTLDTSDPQEVVVRVALPVLVYAALLAFFFLSATNRLKSPAANHSTSFRVYYALIAASLTWIALWLLLNDAGQISFANRINLCLGLLCAMGCLAVFSVTFAAEEPVLPLRLRGQVARMTGVRRVLRPFMPGSLSGATFCTVVNGLLIGSTILPMCYGVLGPQTFNKPWMDSPGLAVPLVAACIFSFLFFLTACGVLFSTIFRRTVVAKGMMGVLLLAVLLVPLVVWLIVVLGRDHEQQKHYWMAAANLPLAIVSVWNGRGIDPQFDYSFAAFGKDVPYSAVFCGLHVCLGVALLAWGMGRRRRLVRLVEQGPIAFAAAPAVRRAEA